MPPSTTQHAQRRLSRRAALRPDRLLTQAALHAAANEPPPPAGLRALGGTSAAPEGGPYRIFLPVALNNYCE